MPTVRIPGLRAIMHVAGDYKPGDPPPPRHAYLDWHEWAEVQHRAGLRQSMCCDCSRWFYPQELSTQEVSYEARTGRGKQVRLSAFRCLECAEMQAAREGGG